MSEHVHPAPAPTHKRWLWWFAVAMLAVAVAVDILDGEPLKLATSALLLVAALLAAATRRPRGDLVRVAIGLSAGASLALLLFRIFRSGL